MARKSSVSIARERLRTLVISDRVQCSPDAGAQLYRELYETLSKYIEFTEQDFHVEITRTYIKIDFSGEKS